MKYLCFFLGFGWLCGLSALAQSTNKEYIYAQKDNTEIIFYIKKGDAAFQNKSLSEAIRYYSKALQLNDIAFNFIIYIKRANVYTALSKWEQAIKDYTAAIKLKPSTIVAYNNRALCYMQTGKYREALSDQSKIIQIDPKTALYYNNRALTYSKQESYDSAIADYGRALYLEPENHLFYFNRANVLFSKGDYANAERDYTRSIDRSSGKYDPAYYYRALCKVELKSFAAALDDVQQAIRVGGKKKRYMEARGNLYVKTKRFVPALQDFNELVKTSPKNIRYLLNRANIFEKMQRTAPALADYKRVTGLDKQNYEARVGSMRIKLRNNSLDSVQLVRSLENLVQQNPNKTDASFALAQYYLKKRQYKKALSRIKICIGKNPDHADYLAFNSLIEFRMGNPKEAALLLKRALNIEPTNPSFLSLKQDIPNFQTYQVEEVAPVKSTIYDKSRALDRDPSKVLPDQSKPVVVEDEDDEDDEDEEVDKDEEEKEEDKEKDKEEKEDEDNEDDDE